MTNKQPAREYLSEDARKNREHWDQKSDHYQKSVGTILNTQECAWGVWAAPESELHVLGEVKGKDILDYGCGAAQWSINLSRQGARPVGLDNSSRQLYHARRLMKQEGLDFPLINASGENVPLPDGSFDIVISDHGAMSFVNPEVSIREVARLLRPGGLLAFNIASPFRLLCDDGKGWPDSELHSSYFLMGRNEDESGQISYTLTNGEWIRLFRQHGFIVEDLIEYRPGEDSDPSFYYCAVEWARKWPAENIWKVRKKAG